MARGCGQGKPRLGVAVMAMGDTSAGLQPHACRICWSAGLPLMVSPCLCKGSARVVHLACLKRYVTRSPCACRGRWQSLSPHRDARRWAVSNLALWGQRWWLRCPTCKADYMTDVSLELAQVRAHRRRASPNPACVLRVAGSRCGCMQVGGSTQNACVVARFTHRLQRRQRWQRGGCS